MAKRKVDADKPISETRMEVDGDDDGDDTESILNVDFEFFGLSPSVDFHGLKTLLKQLFDVDNELFDLSELTDLLLSQADHVGTAVKCDGEESDPYAFISVLNVEQHREKEVVKQLTRYLASKGAALEEVTRLLQPGSGERLGVVLTERFINMPHQVVPPMFSMLQREMAAGGGDFDFTHLLILSKTYTEVESSLEVDDDRPPKKQKAQQKTAETFYFHPEDEVLQRHAVAHGPFDYDKSGDDGRSDSKRTFQELGVRPRGHFMLIEKQKLDGAIKAVAEYLSTG